MNLTPKEAKEYVLSKILKNEIGEACKFLFYEETGPRFDCRHGKNQCPMRLKDGQCLLSRPTRSDVSLVNYQRAAKLLDCCWPTEPKLVQLTLFEEEGERNDTHTGRSQEIHSRPRPDG